MKNNIGTAKRARILNENCWLAKTPDGNCSYVSSEQKCWEWLEIMYKQNGPYDGN